MKRFTAAVLAAASLGCAPAAARTPEIAADSPSLLVLITVDQLRGDYIDRWSAQLSGGLARLARTGAYFPNGFHDHAITETAPGHASVGSGRFPVSTGIAANIAGVADPSARLVDEPFTGASPRRFQGTAIADWIVARHRDARVVSVSAKDRGAILPLGRYRGQVFWYVQSGRFTTSTYYMNQVPQWVQNFNSRRVPMAWAGRTWNLLLGEDAYPEPDSVPAESNGRDYVFPYALPSDILAVGPSLFTFPWLDDLTLSFALEAVRAQQLGRGNRLDLLAISLSATDYIGHRWGPDSRELHDQVLRLDRSLGGFLDTLFTLVDSRRVVLALTADHGVAPLPEIAARGVAPRATRVNFGTLLGNLRAWVAASGGDSLALSFGSGALSVNRQRLAGSSVDVDSLRQRFIAAARGVPGVASVATLEELAQRDTTTDQIARRWLHMFRPGQDVLAVVTLEPYNIWSYGIPATHGSPHDYDAHVPILFLGEPFKPGRYADSIRVVDLAPTLAQALGIQPLEQVDGRVLSEVLR